MINKWCFILFVFTSFLFSNPNKYVGEQYCINNRLIIEDNLIIRFQDASMWMLIFLQPRTRTWGEWWNYTQIEIDENFLWQKNDWQVEDEIFIHNSYLEDSFLDNLTMKDRKKIKGCIIILENLSNRKKAFAKNISFDTLISLVEDYANNQYQKGYSCGYNMGYVLGSMLEKTSD